MEKFDNKLKYFVRGILVFFIFEYSVYLQYIPVILFHLDVSNLSDRVQVMLSTFSSFLLVFIFSFIYRKNLRKEFLSFKEHLVENMDIGLKYWFIGLMVMMVSNLIITYVFHAGGANNENAVQEMIHSLPWLMIINAGILAPFNEEIVFRKTLKDIFHNKWIFIFLSFLLFGGAHVISSAETILDYLYIIPYGALGAAFALTYYETDTVFTSISMHMIHNIALVLLSIMVL